MYYRELKKVYFQISKLVLFVKPKITHITYIEHFKFLEYLDLDSFEDLTIIDFNERIAFFIF